MNTSEESAPGKPMDNDRGDDEAITSPTTIVRQSNEFLKPEETICVDFEKENGESVNNKSENGIIVNDISVRNEHPFQNCVNIDEDCEPMDMSIRRRNESEDEEESDEGVLKMEVDGESPGSDDKISKSGSEDRPMKLEEGEEEFKGFPAVIDETQSQDLVKNLSQKEETELQEMEVSVKRKEEICLSPPPKKRKREVDESDLSSRCSSPGSGASQTSGLSNSKRSRTGSTASRGSRRSTLDLSHPKYRVPFKFGWRREVVTRGITREDGITKDIYYFHPSGKKLRSLREVSEKLTPGVTIENFTFYKEPLGADPPFETLRKANPCPYREAFGPRPKMTSPNAKTRSSPFPTRSRSSPLSPAKTRVSPVSPTKTSPPPVSKTRASSNPPVKSRTSPTPPPKARKSPVPPPKSRKSPVLPPKALKSPVSLAKARKSPVPTPKSRKSPVPPPKTCESSVSPPKAITSPVLPAKGRVSPVSATKTRGASPVPPTKSRGESPIPPTKGRVSPVLSPKAHVSPVSATKTRAMSPVPPAKSRDASPVPLNKNRGTSPPPPIKNRGTSPSPPTRSRGSSPISSPKARASPIPPPPKARASPIPPTKACASPIPPPKSRVSPVPPIKARVSPVPSAKARVSPVPPTKARAVKTSAELPPVKDTPAKEPSPVKESPKPAPLKNFVKTPKEPVAKPPPSKREKLVLKFNKGTPKIALKKSVAINGERKSPKVIVPKVEGPKPHPNAPSGPRRKITPRKKPVKPPNGAKEEGKVTGKPEGGDLEMGMLPPMWSPTAGSTKSSSNESLSWSHLDEEKSSNEEGRMDPCTIRCPKAMGLIPTLQCSVCLCLYHPECCDITPTSSYRQLPKYVCKNCQAKVNEAKSRNLVKHITPAVVTDKNPPIISPKPIHPSLIPSPTLPTPPNVVRMPHLIRPKIPAAKTNWLPPTNSVFRSPANPKNYSQKTEEAATPPQALVNMNNKRYIVVPKNNVLSVASNQNQSPNKADPPQSTTIITPTPTSTIIQGPPLQNNPFVQPTANPPGVVLVPFMPGENLSTDTGTQHYLVVNPLPGASTTPVSSQADLPTGTETVNHFPKPLEKTPKKPTTDTGNESMQKFMRNICIGYSALLNVFQYLKVQELLRAGRVCRLWRDLASHSSLWRTVRMKNSQVSDWKGFTDSLSRHGTKHLDLRKILMSLDDAEQMWSTFAKNISNVKCLERLDMCRCAVSVISQIMEACPQLTVFNAQMMGVKDQALNQKLSLESVSKMKNLKELRLKSFFGLHIVGSLKPLTELAGTLTTLSLTSVKNLGSCDLHFIGKLNNLEALELGECCDLPETFPSEVIAKLTTLKRIRLEKGPWNYSTNEMLYQMSKLKELIQLELINFDVRPGFDKALASCTNIKRLLLIPTYVTQSATTNNIILSGTFQLWNSLTHFVWVVTMELLKVTELFVDQCEGKGSKKSGGNSVPVLKPVPIPAAKLKGLDSLRREDHETGGRNMTPITVIPIDELFQMLTEALPNTKVKLLKIPFQNTWRQSITEGSS